MKRVAIIDDDREIAYILERLLKREDGLIIKAYTNALQALDDARKGVFDIILLDVVMPQINGIHFLQKVRDFNAQTKIIIMTSDATLDRVTEAHRNRADDFIQKPFKDLGELKERILS